MKIKKMNMVSVKNLDPLYKIFDWVKKQKTPSIEDLKIPNWITGWLDSQMNWPAKPQFEKTVAYFTENISTRNYISGYIVKQFVLFHRAPGVCTAKIIIGTFKKDFIMFRNRLHRLNVQISLSTVKMPCAQKELNALL
ncbi:hypothetical protein NEPAR06_1909 [Nematocida parisii]|uniref:Uncharacterized protein n=1 Tax=Nematocida parisii (strain ERTm3) TaxID=935791 RepID=I3EEA0_NEMP3|nr:uncharacterized protein NEPG_02592 [Nematocida parisii ERTm1]EIJ87547.1 hypothetical protein NEQG_02094 [Nematocida parisii ERTm3]EIJ92578.1 hypothetical protein NEPG_02592 [Nematocida parisii ERTm1]KAI5146429.1 hypothetical protein NEPAR07_2370 [Nematocida parisii]KAI5155527.1 hypothetical protein NEPAR06_1909 [Nematocida parisii]|eukprot:XP_013060419.1 hypothetical protein NEPG_02592 [Nematocida parisii ERTm1]